MAQTFQWTVRPFILCVSIHKVLLRNQESFRLLMSSKPNDEECPSTRSHDIRRGNKNIILRLRSGQYCSLADTDEPIPT